MGRQDLLFPGPTPISQAGRPTVLPFLVEIPIQQFGEPEFLAEMRNRVFLSDEVPLRTDLVDNVQGQGVGINSH